MIHDISSIGAVKLATLEGEEMPNWISGCKLKKYYLSLTPEMVFKIHYAREQKQMQARIKQQAKDEAKERMAKRKQYLRTLRLVEASHKTTTKAEVVDLEEITTLCQDDKQTQVEVLADSMPLPSLHTIQTDSTSDSLAKMITDLMQQDDLETEMGDTKCVMPYIHIQIASTQIDSYALLDTGAQFNVFSHELYQKLHEPTLIQEQQILKIASGATH